MTRDEHLAWSKERALEYADRGDLGGALASFVSDLGKHRDTEGAARIAAGPLGAFEMVSGTPQSMRRFIEGFS